MDYLTANSTQTYTSGNSDCSEPLVKLAIFIVEPSCLQTLHQRCPMSDIQPTEPEHLEEQTALEAALRKTLPWFSANLTTVIYALAGILAIAAIVVFLQRQPAGNTEASKLLLVATTPEEYQDIADSAPTSLLGMWSRLRQADRLLDNAVTNMFTDREQGLEDLSAAKDAYENLGSQSGLPDALRERVLIGMARVSECECDGSEKAIEAVATAWQQVLGAFPESIMKSHAEARIARMENPEAAEFYEWFAALDPKPVLPGAGSVPEIPDGLLKNDPLDGIDLDTDEAAESEAAKPDEAKPDSAAADTAENDNSAEADSEAKMDEGESAKAEKPAKVEEPAAAAKEEAASTTTEPAKADKPVEAVKEKAEEAAGATKPETAVSEAAKSEPETAKSDGDN